MLPTTAYLEIYNNTVGYFLQFCHFYDAHVLVIIFQTNMQLHFLGSMIGSQRACIPVYIAVRRNKFYCHQHTCSQLHY